MKTEKKLFGAWNEVVLLILGFVLTSLFGVIITAKVQDKTYQNQHRQAFLETEKEQSFKVFQDLADLMDKRIYKMRKIIWAYDQPSAADTIKKRWADYALLLEDWNGHINKNLALLHHYFGENKRSLFLDSIHNELRLSGHYLEQYKRLVNDHKPNEIVSDSLLKQCTVVLDKVNRNVYFFDIDLLDDIQSTAGK